MKQFSVDPVTVQAQSEVARQLGQEGSGEARLEQLVSDNSQEDIQAASLLLDRSVATQQIATASQAERGALSARI